MMTKSLLSLAVLAGAASATLAGAGQTSVNEVSIYIPSNTYVEASASGAVDDIRRSADSLQYIGCTIHGYRNSGSTYSGYVSCFARDANGQGAFCYTRDPSPQMATAIAAIDDRNYMGFFWTQSSGECKTVMAQKDSRRVVPRTTTVAQ